jgi:hypothetical protein
MVVTSGVIPIPLDWMTIPSVRVAVSVDGLPEHHDIRRKPATYARILKNLEGRAVNIHWVITRPMLERRDYLEEYISFWHARPEVDHIWTSVYTPQIGESSPEMLTPADRLLLADELPRLALQYPKFLMNKGVAQAIVQPPSSPESCVFSKMSANYSADLTTRVEPCVFGGTPDCSQCGCAISSGLHWIQGIKLAGPLKVNHLVEGSIRIGRLANRLRARAVTPARWNPDALLAPMSKQQEELVQIDR